MTVAADLIIVVAGCAAGFINTVVGSGSLVTFPALVALGVPQVSANISNNLGLVPGGLSGLWGYRRELAAQRRAAMSLLPYSVVGSLVGALLLLHLPARVFSAVVPVLVVLALVLVLAQPRLAALIARRDAASAERPRWMAWCLRGGVFAAGIYGGYFGAAQGVILMALLGLLHDPDLQKSNAVKNLLGTSVNLAAAVVFVAVAPERVNWVAVGLIAAGSVLGAQAGAAFGRRLSAHTLRWFIVAVGAVALVRLALDV
jgi:uncharacterized membrane protein YfcA